MRVNRVKHRYTIRLVDLDLGVFDTSKALIWCFYVIVLAMPPCLTAFYTKCDAVKGIMLRACPKHVAQYTMLAVEKAGRS